MRFVNEEAGLEVDVVPVFSVTVGGDEKIELIDLRIMPVSYEKTWVEWFKEERLKEQPPVFLQWSKSDNNH